MLNPRQRKAFEKIGEAFENPNLEKRLFFIDGPGGSGNTFLYNTIMHYVRSKNELVLPCTFTGVAATLLEGGRSSHNLFKPPIPINETWTCNIHHGSNTANELKNAKLIIWDEASMAPAHGVNAVDTFYKDLMAEDPKVCSKKMFRCAVFLIGGDFRQILPVVPHGSRTEIISACMKNSNCWRNIEVLKLDQNMRTNEDNVPEEHQSFSQWLLNLGDGKLQEPRLEQGIFEIPSVCIENGCIVDAVFPQVVQPEDESIANRAILTPKKQHSHELNENVLRQIQSKLKCYTSIDSIHQDTGNAEEAANYPMEFLNSLTPGGMPPHRLNLKVGAVVMPLRNLISTRRLCNGTRMVVKQIMSKGIDCEIPIGSFKGTRVFIPRVILAPSDPDLPFTLKRKQFPLRLKSRANTGFSWHIFAISTLQPWPTLCGLFKDKKLPASQSFRY
ncbi:ATP-dependent DNA helicase pif1-like [Phyllobates terribilis]|uniref:ATP-dependent DNA helicase pif1-like n=1 Tax=Phyllobates terribilis TaxID=111132 RepID=UPI003CCB6C50